MINKDLMNFLNTQVYVVYSLSDVFDKGHDERHIDEVKKYAIDIAKEVGYKNMNILLTAVYYHDVGIAIERDNHNIYSGKIVREDHRLKQFLSDAESEAVIEAVEEHRTDCTKSSMLSKIVADADKLDGLLDINRMFERCILFTMSYKPELTGEDLFEEVHKHLLEKCGSNGRIKLSINSIENKYESTRLRVNSILNNRRCSHNIFDIELNKIVSRDNIVYIKNEHVEDNLRDIV